MLTWRDGLTARFAQRRLECYDFGVTVYMLSKSSMQGKGREGVNNANKNKEAREGGYPV